MESKIGINKRMREFRLITHNQYLERQNEILKEHGLTKAQYLVLKAINGIDKFELTNEDILEINEIKNKIINKSSSNLIKRKSIK